jgi:chondroitin sulfate synthase
LQVQELFYLDQNQVVETSNLFSSDHLIHALTIQPVRYPKYMYRLYSFFLELNYNSSIEQTKTAADEIRITYPFIPTHLRSPFRFKQLQGPAKPDKATQPPATQQHSPTSSSNIFVRPRHVPKNKFEINFWEYFNQTRLMSVYNEQPSRGIIGGLREEARYALTKGIYIANQGLSPKNRLIFEKLENGYHRIDPMRGSEYILDFVFRKSSDRNVRVKKRIGLLRPYHETIVPVDSSNHLDHVNFVVTLSGLSNRLEQFLANFEKNILIPKEDASLTIVLFDGPEKNEVHQMISKYSSRYPASKMSILDVNGEFARGIGLHKGATHFNDNQLLFLVDVDLEISPEFLKRCRLNTIRNKQVYFPIFYKLYNLEFVNKYYRGNDTQFLSRRNGHWAHYSYGMVCIYASDYRRSGGYNIGIRGWGEEDVDLFNKVMSAGLEVFRSPDPGLIHLWHRKICNKDVILSTKAYLHCLHSKAENLADRTELAQYIFEQELKDGNVL